MSKEEDPGRSINGSQQKQTSRENFDHFTIRFTCAALGRIAS
jgi:hypothetical protein